MDEFIACRCCLSTEGGLLPVGNDFSAVLEFMTSSEMVDTDTEEGRVCRRCAHKLRTISKFREVCLKSDTVLRNHRASRGEAGKTDTGFVKIERDKLPADVQPSFSNTLCIDVSPAGDQLERSRAAVVSYARDIRVPKNVSEDMTLVFRKDIKLEADEEANRYSEDDDNDGVDDIDDSFEVLIMGKYAAKGAAGQDEAEPNVGDGLKEIKKEISEDDSAAEDLALCKLARAVKKQSVGKRKRPLPMVYIKKKRETTADSAGTVKKSRKTEKTNKNEPAPKSYVCSKCGKLFQRPCLLKNHSCIVFTLKKDNGCGVCGRAFGSPSKLKEHMLDHTGERPFSCDECGKTFKKAHILRGHLRTHLVERPYPCDLCDSSFLFEKNLQKHRKLHTGDRPYACGTCGKTFVDKTYLKRHEMIHVDEIAFTCDECGLSFAQLSKLNYHKLSHREERPFSCEQCGKAFKLIGQLNNHRSTHTGEKPFTCDVCGRSFRQAGNFNCHKRVHTGERPYTCGVCGNSYTEAGYLKKHKRIHTGEKPFACDVCGKAFVETCGLRRHKLVHTGEQRYSCGECGALFKQPGGLRKHKRKHAADKLAGAAKWRAHRAQDVS